MTKLNQLTNEHSLYLRQHADNPVDWYPWGEEALAQAKREDKPILLSIGYSACHWCHVMAKESFVDADTAAVMNELFINIKVDREERPDLDKIYQTAHQLLTGRGGGWPLTVFLDPQDHSPFFAGTYFPVTSRYGMPAFKEVLHRLAEFFQTNRAAIREHSKQLQAALAQLASMTVDKNLSTVPLDKAIQELSKQFDAVNGGFGAAPKFPHPTTLEFLIRFFSNQQSKSILEMVNITLTKMAQGGIYDQLGGGFFRYSVDAKWHIPHFEKMLYDNAQLLACYVQAYLLTKNELFLDIIKQTIAWLQREMHAPKGGFYATLDADSEHVEGKFYYWDREEVKKLLTADEFIFAEQCFGLKQPPNFEEHWHLYVTDPSISTEKLLSSIKEKLFKARDKRIRPGCDEKIITAWNGLTIKGLALAGQHLQQNAWIELAQTTVDFIRNNLWQDKRLYATYQNNQVQHFAYLDDYAFLLDGLMTLLQARWRSEDLFFAIELAEGLLMYFEDEVNGGFFFTAKDHEKLIHRPKALMDEAVPAGNGIATLALQRLGYLLGEIRYLAAAERTLGMANTTLSDYPSAHCSLLIALTEHLTPPQVIILRGNREECLPWQAVCQQYYDPARLVFAIPVNTQNLPSALSQHVAQPNKVVAYLCTGMQCLAPITNLADFKKLLSTKIVH